MPTLCVGECSGACRRHIARPLGFLYSTQHPKGRCPKENVNFPQRGEGGLPNSQNLCFKKVPPKHPKLPKKILSVF